MSNWAYDWKSETITVILPNHSQRSHFWPLLPSQKCDSHQSCSLFLQYFSLQAFCWWTLKIVIIIIRRKRTTTATMMLQQQQKWPIFCRWPAEAVALSEDPREQNASRCEDGQQFIITYKQPYHWTSHCRFQDIHQQQVGWCRTSRIQTSRADTCYCINSWSKCATGVASVVCWSSSGGLLLRPCVCFTRFKGLINIT